MSIKYIDLFAGIGGFHYGIENVYKKLGESNGGESSLLGHDLSDFSSKSNKRQQATCVYSNEWDKYANSVYRRHFGECDDRDITTVPTSDIPDHDLLVGGFPCQAFSVAGKRGGFNDTRGTLFFEIARILRDKRPRYFILENVKGLLSHDSGKTFQTILRVLSDIGYGVQWQVLNSKDFGVPQNRERVFIVGHTRGTPRPEVFPLTRTNAKDIVQLNQPTHSNDRVYGDDGLAPTLNTMQGGRRQPKILNRKDGIKRNTDIAVTLNSSDWRGLNRNQDQTAVMQDMAIRRLTPIECEKLQGFPPNWTQYGFNGEVISDTQRYKMCGNAVSTPVVTAIVRKLK